MSELEDYRQQVRARDEKRAADRAAARELILQVLSDGRPHSVDDFKGNVRRRYSILGELEREGLVRYHRAYPARWQLITRRHSWDHGQVAAREARFRTCSRCGISGRTYGSGGFRTWSYRSADGEYLGSRLGQIPCLAENHRQRY